MRESRPGVKGATIPTSTSRRSSSVGRLAAQQRIGHELGIERGLELADQVPGRGAVQDLAVRIAQAGIPRAPAPTALFSDIGQCHAIRCASPGRSGNIGAQRLPRPSCATTPGQPRLEPSQAYPSAPPDLYKAFHTPALRCAGRPPGGVPPGSVAALATGGDIRSHNLVHRCGK